MNDSTRTENREARCSVCGWKVEAPDYEHGTREDVNVSTHCKGCGKWRPAYMLPARFLDENYNRTNRENTLARPCATTNQLRVAGDAS